MKRFLLIFALVALLPVCAWGETITPSMAYVPSGVSASWQTLITPSMISDASGTTITSGNILVNESLGGTSTYVITGNLDLNSSAIATYVTAKRPVELNNTIAAIIRLPDMSSLSSVTNDVLFVNVTKNGAATPMAGVTVWSPTNNIIAGMGATWSSGATAFIVGSGNTGFTLALKALNYGSAVTPTWRAWTDADVLRRP